MRVEWSVAKRVEARGIDCALERSCTSLFDFVDQKGQGTLIILSSCMVEDALLKAISMPFSFRVDVGSRCMYHSKL